MAKTARTPHWQRALVILTSTVVGVVAVLALYWAQAVFIPFAFAVFLAFLLTPAVRALQRHGLGRIPSISLVVLVAALFLTGLGWLVARQMSGLVTKLPDYSTNMREKIRSLRELGTGSERFEKMMDELNSELWSKPTRAETSAASAVPDANTTEQPTAVVVRPPEYPAWLGRLPVYLGSTIEAFGCLALALVLTVFILFKRENLRDRFIRLIGHTRMSFTTKAVDDASLRISRYLTMQAILNSAFGLTIATGLFIIGVDYPLLWGLLAATLRYVPYVGIWLAALFPIVLSLAMFSDWWRPLAVIGLFLALDLVTSNVIEPWVFGRSLGVSEVALLIIAALSAFLWGPVGLILAAPLTVCLVVLGKYVPGLQFFDVLLGDGPALQTSVSYYQRLLARDQDEAVDLILSHAKAETPERVYDELLVPALNHAKRDRNHGELTEDDETFIRETTREILEDMGERLTVTALTRNETPVEARAVSAGETVVRILGCPARDESDRLALEMLRQLLDPNRCHMELTEVEMLAAELVEHVAEHQPSLICIGSLPPGGVAHSRYLCKRLRSRFPELKIIVGRWGLKANSERNATHLQEAGATQMTTTLLETRDHIYTLLPIIADAGLPNSRDVAAEHPALDWPQAMKVTAHAN